MRFPAAILIAATLLSAGCTALTGRSGRDRDRDRDHPAVDQRDGDNRWWLDGSETARRKTRPVPADAGRTDRESLLAGMVVDRDGRPLRGVTYIRVRPADELTPASSRGIGFETDSDGNFLCAMLTPGKTYILSVVREIDGRKVAGEMQVKPPQTSLRLEVSEDRVSSVTPPLPPPPGLGPFEPHGPDARTSGDPPIGPPPLPDPPSPLLHKENIAGEPHRPPTAAIRPPPSPAPDTAPPLVTPPNIPEPEPPQANAGPRVPNFTVNDVLGQEWQLRNATGRLVLAEFWSTTCVPCARAVPSIKRLQENYGRSGLEIVAVACEPDASFEDRARAVEASARKKELNYRVYLERDRRVGEVQRLFGVQWVPTLVLLDRQGTILWRGGASEADLSRLDDMVKGYLSRR